MSRRDRQRLDDVQAAMDAIDDRQTRGGLPVGLIYDVARVRLIEIGEAGTGLSADLLATEPDLAWAQIAEMGDRLVPRYFDTLTPSAIRQRTIDHDHRRRVQRNLQHPHELPPRERTHPGSTHLQLMTDQLAPAARVVQAQLRRAHASASMSIHLPASRRISKSHGLSRCPEVVLQPARGLAIWRPVLDIRGAREAWWRTDRQS